MLLLFVLACGTCLLHGAEVEAKLCAYHMKESGTITHPGSAQSKLLPKNFHPEPSPEFCIVYGNIKWTQDLEIKMINSTQRLEINVKNHDSEEFFIPAITLPFSGIHDLAEPRIIPLPIVTIAYVIIDEITLRGNETSQFKILFPRESNISLGYRRIQEQREFLCPELEPHFDVISCTDDRNKDSVCTFRCKENYAPSPLLYQSYLKEKYPEIDQLGQYLPNISSVCGQTETGSPAWSPDAVGWRVYSHFGPDIGLHSTCMSYQDIANACKAASPDYDQFDLCNDYPLDLMLEIYGQKSEPTPPPTTTTIPPTSSPQHRMNLNNIGLDTLSSPERKFIWMYIASTGRYLNCLQPLRNIIYSLDRDSTRISSEIRREKTTAVLKKILRVFSKMSCGGDYIDGIECNRPHHPCSDSCRKAGNKNEYNPKKCGDFPSRREKGRCMWCRIRTNSCPTLSRAVC